MLAIGEPNARKIVGTSPLLNRPLSEHAQMFSTSSGKQYAANNLIDLLNQITVDVLRETLNWTKVVVEIVSSLRDQEVKFTVVRPTSAASAMYKALKAGNIKVTETVEEKPALTTQASRGESEAIAVVGMSGRFPGSESLEEFWGDLEVGRDLVQQVTPAFPYQMYTCLLDWQIDPKGPF